MSVEAPPVRSHKARNIQTSIVMDHDRLDALDAISRGMQVSRSAAVCRLLDLHGGVLLEAIDQTPADRFTPERARARRLTGELVVDVASLVREGMTKADAWRLLSVNAKTAGTWEKRGREDFDNGKGGMYADLVTALEQARAAFNRSLIQEAVRKGDYGKLLKMIDPEQFTPASRQSVDVTHRFQLVIDWDALTIEETRTLALLLRKASPLEDDPAVTRTARPALEAIPEDVAETVDAEEGEWSEASALEAESRAESPGLSESPATSTSPADGGQGSPAPHVDARTSSDDPSSAGGSSQD